ncbi:MAG: hypothetical protein J7K29_06945 [Candidatus Cloacimonetes bacterium]|nr:hypothetical protein [Candidatus Cloacimonadota bacterium]
MPNNKFSRYITSKKHFSKQNNYVKSAAFMPNRNQKLSVFCIDELVEEEIWEIGYNNISIPTSKEIYARANIEAEDILTTILEIDNNNTPLRHADIIGWPSEKEDQKGIALELSRKSALVIKPPLI